MRKLVTGMLLVLALGRAGGALALPIAATVSVDGREWAQVKDFIGLSWDEINTVCPLGVCTDNTLNGYEMAGWRWADVEAVNALFDTYLVEAGLSSGYFLSVPAIYTELNSFWAPEFQADFDLTLTQPSVSSVQGWMSESHMPTARLQGRIGGVDYVFDPDSSAEDRIATIWSRFSDSRNSDTGAWFYRDVSIPTPTTIPLIGLALAVLGLSRKNLRADNG